MKPITEQEIFAAADLLARQGVMPSIKAIRERLGQRGSETTIMKHLRAWNSRLLLRYVNFESMIEVNRKLHNDLINMTHADIEFRDYVKSRIGEMLQGEGDVRH